MNSIPGFDVSLFAFYLYSNVLASKQPKPIELKFCSDLSTADYASRVSRSSDLAENVYSKKNNWSRKIFTK